MYGKVLCVGKPGMIKGVVKTSFRDFQSPEAVLALFAASWSLRYKRIEYGNQ